MIRKRVVNQPGKTGHERWVVSYADFITLLFSFFVVMYSVSQVSENKYRALSETLASTFVGKVDNELTRHPAKENHAQPYSGQIAGLSPQFNLIDTATLAQRMSESLFDLVELNQATVRGSEDWVQIDVSANLLFPSGSAQASAEAKDTFRRIAALLAPYDNEIQVAGHTDDLPIQTDRFGSNWELSAARATSVVRLLAEDGIDPMRLSATGYGPYRPVADNDTKAGRAQNRRVVLMVSRGAVERPSLPAGKWAGQTQVAPPAKAAGRLPLNDSGTPASSEASTSADQSEPRESTPTENPLAPVRLKQGGLLFTTDPKQRGE